MTDATHMLDESSELLARQSPKGVVVVEETYQEVFSKNITCTQAGSIEGRAFVRHIGGMEFCHVSVTETEWQEKIQLALHQIGKNLHFLIVGAHEDDLKEALATDVAIVAAQAGLPASEINAIELQASACQEIITDAGVFVLLVAPTFDELQAKLRHHLDDMPSLNAFLCFSGHGLETCGDWLLREDTCYSGHDLKTFVGTLNRRHGGDLTLLLNSCHGLKFVENMKKGAAKDVISFLTGFTGKDEGFFNALVNAADSNAEEVQQANEVFANHCLAMYCRDHRCFPAIRAGTNLLYVVPFTPGPLDGQGVLKALFQVSSDDVQMITAKFDKRALRKLSRSDQNPLTSRPQDPELFAFAAGFGDSTLIRFDGINILIDGGSSTSQPCYWPVVSRLPAGEILDVVILTHQDVDHLRGIKRLLQSADRDMFGKVYCLEPPSTNDKPHTNATSGGAVVWNLAHSKGCANALEPGDIDLGNDKIKLKLLAPKEKVAQEARKWMKLRRTLTAPNRASAIIYLEIARSDGSPAPIRALFTGDAPAATIVDALDGEGLKGESFDYIDVPHHGSSHNKSELLFTEERKVKIAAVSTNGAGLVRKREYCHPDPSVLELLNSRLGKSIEKLAFTYQDHFCGESPSRDKPVQDFFAESLDYVVFANNSWNDPFPPPNCLKINLATANVESVEVQSCQ